MRGRYASYWNAYLFTNWDYSFAHRNTDYENNWQFLMALAHFDEIKWAKNHEIHTKRKNCGVVKCLFLQKNGWCVASEVTRHGRGPLDAMIIVRGPLIDSGKSLSWRQTLISGNSKLNLTHNGIGKFKYLSFLIAYCSCRVVFGSKEQFDYRLLHDGFQPP